MIFIQVCFGHFYYFSANARTKSQQDIPEHLVEDFGNFLRAIYSSSLLIKILACPSQISKLYSRKEHWGDGGGAGGGGGAGMVAA
jgi:hypothetical protein